MSFILLRICYLNTAGNTPIRHGTIATKLTRDNIRVRQLLKKLYKGAFH